MKPTMQLRLVPASDYMIETYFYECRNAIPHLKLQQLWEGPEEPGYGGSGIYREWRDVEIVTSEVNENGR